MRHAPTSITLTLETSLTPRRTLLVAQILAAAAVLAIGCQAGDPGRHELAQPGAGGAVLGVGRGLARAAEIEAELSPAVARIEEAAEEVRGFSNVAIDGVRGAVVVYLTDVHSRRAVDRLLGLAGGVPLVIKPAVLDRAEAARMTALLEGARAGLVADGVAIREFGPSGTGGRYRVWVSSEPHAARWALARRVGGEVASAIDVAEGEPDPMRLARF